MTVVPTRDEVPRPVHRPSLPGRRGPAVGPGSPGRSTSGGLTGRDIWRMIRKHLVLIIISVVACTFCFGVATLLWGLYAPYYTATALMRVSAPRTDPLRDPGIQGREIIDQIKNSQMAMIKSEAVLGSAADDENMRNTSWYNEHRGTLVEDLDEAISVRSVPATFLIAISMRAVAKDYNSRVELTEVVNAVARAAEKDSKEIVQRSRREQIDQFDKQQRELVDTLARIERNIEEARDRFEDADPEDRRTTLGIRIERELRRIMDLEAYILQMSLRMEATKAMDANELSLSPEVNEAVNNDPMLNSLKATETNLSTDLDKFLLSFGPNHKKIQEIKDTLQAVRLKIQDKEKEVRENTAKAILEGQKLALADALDRLEKAQNAYELLETESKDLQNTLLDIKKLQQDYAVLSARKAQIDDHLLRLRMLLATEEHLQLYRPATIPRFRSLPRWSQMIPLGVFLGLVIGMGLTFLLELANTSIRNPADIARKVDLPLLGMIPHTDDVEEEIADLRLAFMTNPNSLISEAFRQTCTCLQFSGPADRRRSVLITSPSPRDGRSTVAMNLAAASALSGRRVLVVDANFRQPVIHQLFGDCGRAGLSNALVGQTSWRELVHQVDEHLHVMAAGPLPPNPAELLGSEPMRRLIDEMTGQYGQVIFDGPPCLVVSDACILSTLVDSVVMVVRAGANTNGIVQRARDMLYRVGVEVLGVVLNGVRATAGGYLRKNYETFYDYQEYHEPAPQLETAAAGTDLPTTDRQQADPPQDL